MEKRFTDLRFVIGLFFSITGILLLIAWFTVPLKQVWEKDVNLYAGLAVLIFGIGMFLAAMKNKQVD